MECIPPPNQIAESTMSLDLMFSCPEAQLDKNVEQYVLELIEKMQSIHKIARSTLKYTQKGL